ncbi:creatinase [Cryobacterium frigoriphilum]|uniref:Creatinase n=1 Tax=Cryobacterium frigoriphilum TaxID=1259150 RepID=A0A4V3IRX2_9MICO|nr:creatinase [Cryobacterium frigoriphilum]
MRAEYLSPAELDSALAATAVAYLPLGTLEFHSSHLPIGLDALTAHGLCVASARHNGGIVLPPLYQGTGGGHAEYPWTIMMHSAAGIRSHLEQTLQRLEALGVRLAVLFTGHFADEQLTMIDTIAADWAVAGSDRGTHTMRVFATAVNRCGTAPIAPDHAGVFETTLLHALWPQLVHVDRLPALSEHAAIDPGDNDQGPQRHDPEHPLWGIFGPDPRDLDLSASAALLDALVAWLGGEVTARTADFDYR